MKKANLIHLKYSLFLLYVFDIESLVNVIGLENKSVFYLVSNSTSKTSKSFNVSCHEICPLCLRKLNLRLRITYSMNDGILVTTNCLLLETRYHCYWEYDIKTE